MKAIFLFLVFPVFAQSQSIDALWKDRGVQAVRQLYAMSVGSGLNTVSDPLAPLRTKPVMSVSECRLIAESVYLPFGKSDLVSGYILQGPNGTVFRIAFIAVAGGNEDLTVVDIAYARNSRSPAGAVIRSLSRGMQVQLVPGGREMQLTYRNCTFTIGMDPLHIGVAADKKSISKVGE